jgi:hypothetical protein
MRGPEFCLKFIAITGLQVGLEILGRDKRQKCIAKIRGITFVVDQDVRPLMGKCSPERDEGAGSRRAV